MLALGRGRWAVFQKNLTCKCTVCCFYKFFSYSHTLSSVVRTANTTIRPLYQVFA